MGTTIGDVSKVLFNVCRISFKIHLLIMVSNALLVKCEKNVLWIPVLSDLPAYPRQRLGSGNFGRDQLAFGQQQGKLQFPPNQGLIGQDPAEQGQPPPGNVGLPNLGYGGIGGNKPVGNGKFFNNIPEGEKRRPKPTTDRIADSEECRDDYVRLCTKVAKMNNFAVLECLQNSNKDTSTVLNPECNQHLWSYKMGLTQDKRFREAASQVCRKELGLCEGVPKFGAELLSCLIENVKEVEDTHCRQFVNRMEIITFSDYRLLQPFYSKCNESIINLKCGNVEQKTDQAIHQQGKTIQCLEKKLSKVDRECKAALLRIAELSSDDYHKDRALYFACRGDQDRFCDKETAGEGRIYKCLLKHKKEKDMSDECFDALTVRQRVVSADVKVNKQLIKSCRREIASRNCAAQGGTKEFSLASLLLCLEKNATLLSGECQAELFDIRKSLMEDYKVNPEIITACEDDINTYCRGLRREGKTLHCLMERAMKEKLSTTCNPAVLALLKEVKAGSDYRLDPILAKTCSSSKGALCSKIPAGDAKVLSCLMDNVDSDLMDKQCAQKLYELQYFVSRDYTLDHQLFVACKKDAKTLCYNGEKKIDGSMFACLHNHLHEKTGSGLSSECSNQVHRALRQRAALISMNPMIEKKCRSDLGHFCGEEKNTMDCLQNNFEKLSPGCKFAVGNFTQEQSEDIRMNKALMKACSPMLKRYCQDSLRRKVDEGDALACLISHKNDGDMDPKCAAGIEHFQIVQLKDYMLSFKFKQACKTDVQSLCKDVKRKYNVLTCLSEEIRRATLLGKKHNVSENCRAQVKFEMLQKSEDIKLDPGLSKACNNDWQKFCPSKTNGNAEVLECLRKYEEKLSHTCYQKVFNRARELQEKPEWDYFLMKACQQFIKTTCKSSKNPLMDCLQSHLHDVNIDPGCKKAVSQRMQEETRDFRLNPTMRRVCVLDISKFCQEKRKAAKDDKMMHGEMMKCLRDKLNEGKKVLTPLCEKYVRHMQAEAALNFELDPNVKKACSRTAKEFCVDALSQPGEGLVIECLKDLLKQQKLQDARCKAEIVRLTAEGVADVQVDPLLEIACSLDLKHYCHGVMTGHGQQMACLLEALEDKSVRLQTECERILKDRKELWDYAAEEIVRLTAEGVTDVQLNPLLENGQLHRLSLNRSFSEMNVPSGIWKYIIGGTCVGIAFAFLICGFQKKFMYLHLNHRQ